jgi:hypothetical protein
VGGGNEGEVFLVGKFVLVAEAAVARRVAEVGAAEVGADAAGIVAEPLEHVGVPMAVVADELAAGGGIGGGLVFGAVGPEDGLFGGAVPMVEVGEGLFEVLKAEDIDKGERGLDDFGGEWGGGLVAIAEDEVVRIVALNGDVRDLVVARGEFAELGPAGVGGEQLWVEERAFPFVTGPGVNPERAVGIEIANEFGIVGEAAALATGDVITPFGEIGALKIGQLHFVIPLVGFGEGEEMAVREAEPLVFFVGEAGGVAMDGVAANDDLLRPAHGVEAPGEQVRADGFLEPALGAVAVFRLPEVARFGIAERRGVDMVEAKAEEGATLGSDEPPAVVTLGQFEIGSCWGRAGGGGGCNAGNEAGGADVREEIAPVHGRRFKGAGSGDPRTTVG